MLIRELAEEVVVDVSDEGTEVRFRMPPVPVSGPGTSGFPLVGGAPIEVGPEPRLRADDPAGARVAVEGDLDLAGAAAVRRDLLRRADRGGTLELTLPSDCYISSAGIALLTELAQRAAAAGGGLTVVSPPGSAAQRILQLAALDRVIAVTAP